MGALNLVPSRAGTIRRVVRLGNCYICGLCRSRYDQQDQAQSCVQRCWGELLSFDPVITRRRTGGYLFRCRFCARDYEIKATADRCAKECLNLHRRRFELEQSMVEQSLQEPPRRFRSKPQRVFMSPAPIQPPKRKPKPAEAEPVASAPAPTAAPISADVGPVPPTEASAPAPVPAPEPAVDAAAPASDTGNKKKPADVFFRDGARYVCTVCHEKYFTKGEVTACYEKHP